MSGEQRGPIVKQSFDKMGGRDEMIKASINLQELRRKIYLKAKSKKTCSVMASVGTGGVEIG
jgi:hypothetical protein